MHNTRRKSFTRKAPVGVAQRERWLNIGQVVLWRLGGAPSKSYACSAGPCEPHRPQDRGGRHSQHSGDPSDRK